MCRPIPQICPQDPTDRARHLTPVTATLEPALRPSQFALDVPQLIVAGTTTYGDGGVDESARLVILTGASITPRRIL